MDLPELIDAVEQVIETDEQRQETFQCEFERLEEGETNSLIETRRIIAEERDRMERLEELLETERDKIQDLREGTQHLSVEQAVRHRDQAVSKLESHNEYLREFVQELETGLNIVESNLDILENDGIETLNTRDAGPESHFENAQDALEKHNKRIEDVDTNLRILTAYLT